MPAQVVKPLFLALHASATSCLLQSSLASAVESNIDVKSVTWPTSQSAMPRWLKAVASWNMLFIVVTELVSQTSSALNAWATKNVPYMFVTLLVSQASGWSKDTAPSNVVPMFETLLVSQASFELKDLA